MATGPFGSSISSRHFVDEGVPVIRGSNLSELVGIRLIDEGLVFLEEEKAGTFRRSIARRGDLVFTCWGTIGQVGLIDGRAKYSEYVVSNKQMKLTPDPSKASGLFLYYLLSSPAVRERIQQSGIGSSVPGFNLGQLKSLRVSVPPLSEQRAIAEILGAIDDKIELNRQMNRTLEEIAQTLFRAWFVDFEGQTELVESELGPIPRGWKVVSLPTVIEVNPSHKLQKKQVAPYVEMKNLPVNHARVNAWRPRAYTSGSRFQNGDTLLARITPCLENGKTAFVDFLDEGHTGWGSTEFLVLRSKPPLPPEYTYFLGRTSEFRDFAIAQMTGSSGRQRVRPQALKHYQVVVPPAELAHRFGEVARLVIQRLKANDEQSRTLADLRDTLLPKLISGEIRVPEAEELAREAV